MQGYRNMRVVCFMQLIIVASANPENKVPNIDVTGLLDFCHCYLPFCHVTH